MYYHNFYLSNLGNELSKPAVKLISEYAYLSTVPYNVNPMREIIPFYMQPPRSPEGGEGTQLIHIQQGWYFPLKNALGLISSKGSSSSELALFLFL